MRGLEILQLAKGFCRVLGGMVGGWEALLALRTEGALWEVEEHHRS